MYTVVNRVGVPSPEHVKSDDELFAYLRMVTVCLLICLPCMIKELLCRADCAAAALNICQRRRWQPFRKHYLF